MASRLPAHLHITHPHRAHHDGQGEIVDLVEQAKTDWWNKSGTEEVQEFKASLAKHSDNIGKARKVVLAGGGALHSTHKDHKTSEDPDEAEMMEETLWRYVGQLTLFLDMPHDIKKHLLSHSVELLAVDTDYNDEDIKTLHHWGVSASNKKEDTESFIDEHTVFISAFLPPAAFPKQIEQGHVKPSMIIEGLNQTTSPHIDEMKKHYDMHAVFSEGLLGNKNHYDRFAKDNGESKRKSVYWASIQAFKIWTPK